MEKDYAGEMMCLKEEIEKSGKKVQNISYIGNLNLIELVNKESYSIPKDIYLCDVIIKDEHGKEITIKEYFSEDLKLIAIEDERFENQGNSLMLSKEYKEILEIAGENTEKPEILEKLEELDKEGKISLNKINEENLPKIMQVAESLNIDKENIKNLSEIDLERIQKGDTENKITANSKMSINLNTQVSTNNNMSSLLKLQGQGYIKIDIVDLGKGPIFVGTKQNGQMEEIDTIKPIYGLHPNRTINAVNSDGTKVEEKSAITMFSIDGSKDEQLAIGMGKLNTLEVSLVRTSPETNQSVSIPVETNTLVHTSGEVKELMNGNRNGSITEETRKIEEHQKEGCNNINLKDIDDDPTNDTHEHIEESELYVPGTDITWQEFANKLGYRGEGSIEIVKKKFEKEKEENPQIDNIEIINDMEEEAIEQSGPDLTRNEPE